MYLVLREALVDMMLESLAIMIRQACVEGIFLLVVTLLIQCPFDGGGSVAISTKQRF